MAIDRPNWLSLGVFLFACLLTSLFGSLFTPGDWYAGLNIAPWSPPNIAFPIVWSVLYVLIAIAGWCIYRAGRPGLLRLWIIQLIANGAWSWIFFGQHWVLLGLIDLLLLDVLVLVLITGSWRAGLRTVVWLLLPYIVWLLLATSLNAYILAMN